MTAYSGYVLGLDLATRTGWAVADLSSGKVVEHGAWDYGKSGDSGRFFEFAHDLNRLFPYDKPTAIAYEDFVLTHGVPHVALGMIGIIKAYTFQFSSKLLKVAPQTLKKFVTGSGRAGARKDEMIAAAQALGYDIGVKHRKRDGTVVLDDDEADAIHVALWACEQLRSSGDE